MILYTRQGEALTPNHKTVTGRYLLIRDKPCWRCGGAGGAEAWRHTGWTCYRCAGTGIDPAKERIKLYTAEQNAKLDAAAEKRAAKAAVIKAERDRIEAERRAAEKAEMISGWSVLLAEIDAELEHDDNDILSSVKERITEQVKDPTDRQLEVVRKIIADRQSDRARRETAHHVGQIKERREFTLTLLYTRSGVYEMPGVGPIPTYWSLFTDENGCKVACKSAPHLLGLGQTIPEGGKWDDRRYEVGQTVKVKATVVKHEIDKNDEPVTYINRPKAA